MLMHTRGFTIVELLIVIIVISILATVTVVAFQGLNQRAKNSATLTAVNGVEKFWRLYRAQNDNIFEIDSADAVAAGVGAKGSYYYNGISQSGVCIGSSWPNEVRAQGTDYMWDYCNSRAANSNFTRGVPVDLFDKAVAKSGELARALPAMPSIPSINIFPNDLSSPITQRGIRYANSYNANRSYVFYAVASKTCFSGDRSVNYSDTVYTNYGGGGGAIPSASLDGDYTKDNSQYCVRTLTW